MQLKLPTAADIAQKRVIVRVDYNVPLKEAGGKLVVADDRRIRASLETISFLISNQAKVILISHLGRPSGKVDQSMSLAPVAELMNSELQLPVKFIPDCVGAAATAAVTQMSPGSAILLENLRFYAQEEDNQANFARQLASHADVYINDAFSVSHRAHASTVGITEYLPSFAGFNLEKEVRTLNQLLTQPQRPFYIVVGGAKISDKVDTLSNLAKIADGVLVGGGVANVFLKAEGIETHHSYLEDAPIDDQKKQVDYLQVADKLIEANKADKIIKDGYIPLPKVIYPVDVVAAASPDSTETQVLDLSHDAADTLHDQDLMYLDIGPKTSRLYSELIREAGAVFWNGPMGVFEKEPFKAGTTAVARALADSTAVSVLGGGDTVAAVEELGLENDYAFVSTAGSAGLEFLAGKTLPGIVPLRLNP